MYKPGQELVYCGNRTFRSIINGRKRYYELRDCSYCGNDFLTDKYGNVEYCSSKCKENAGETLRGRPIGTELDDYSKNLIANSRTGRHHTKETKQKISEQVETGLADTILECFLSGEEHPWYKHGGGGSPLWFKWTSIKQRCSNSNNKAYKYYGAKGIKVCEEWSEFILFRDWCESNGYEKGLHLHRTDPLGDYGPDNCVFLTPSEHSKLHHELRRQGELI